MENPKPNRFKAGMIVLATVAAIAVAVVAGLMLAGDRHQDEPVLESGAGEVIPANAFKVVLADGEQQWWDALGRMMPQELDLAGVDLAGAPAAPVSLAYAEYPAALNEGPGYSRVFIAETSSDAAARQLVRWIDGLDGAESRNGSVIGRFITFHDVTHMPMEEATETLGDLAALGLAGTDPAKAHMWVDLTGMEQGLSRDAGTAKVLADVLPKVSGYAPGSKVLLASDNGTHWAGTWSEGGLDRARIDPEGAADALYASAKRTGIEQPGTGEATSDSETSIMEGGQWELLRAMLVLTDDGKSAGDLPEELRPAQLPVGAVTNVFNTQVFNAFGADRMWMLEDNLYAAWAFNDKEVRYELYAR